MSTENTTDLLNYNWDNEQDDFFGITATPDNVTTVTPEGQTVEDEDNVEPNNGSTTSTTQVQTSQEDELDDDDFFSEKPEKKKPGPKPRAKVQDTEDEEEADTSVTESPETKDFSIYTDAFRDFKEKGIFKHVELDEDEDIDDERFYELQEEEIETEISERLKSWAQDELDEDAQAFIKFKRQGGSTKDFFKTYQSSTDIPEGDINDEDYQDEVIRYQLQEEGWDRDEIEDRLEYLTTSGKKDKIAKKYEDKLKETRESNKQALLEQTQAQREQIQKNKKQFQNTLREALQNTEEVKGFKISKEEKGKLFNLITKEDQKLSDGRVITGFQKKLSEAFKDSEKMILLAKLIDSDFDMSSFEKKTITNKTRKVKSNLEQRKGLRSPVSGSSTGGGNSLADFFD